MAFAEAVRVATGSLWAHKMRSVLTLLGVVIGVSAVIAVVSLINGANSYVAEKIFNLGTDVIVLSRGTAVPTNIDDFLETQRRKRITLEDYEALRDQCRSCADAGASINRTNAETKYGMNYLRDTNLRGWTPSMIRMFGDDFELTAGRHITEGDMQRSAAVCAIGWDVAENLFAGVDPLGKELRVDGEVYEIVGVGKKLGSVLGQSRDNWVIIPIMTFQKTYGSQQWSIRIFAKAAAPEHLEFTMDEVRQIMRGRRHLGYAAKDDFALETQESFLAIWGNLSSTFFIVTVAIASISLLVGGIVIMNIMLVSVTERTREIGLRKSVGARRHDILLQFLVESATIAAVGGLWGVLIGVLLAKMVSWVTPLPSAIATWSVLSGLGVATVVGLFFGIYPASKAARLDPVVALRAE
jgi:putative ABC transport system permease protein